MSIEVATARTESYSENSRSQKKLFTLILKVTCARRDFTINAMAMNILPNQFGELTDPYNGIEDIRCKEFLKLL